VPPYRTLQQRAGFSLEKALLASELAPVAIGTIGVARLARFCRVLFRITGLGICSTDQRIPAAIPRMIGFVRIPFKVERISSLVKSPLPGRIKLRITTAMALYKGTMAMIISGAMPEVP